MWFIKDTWRTCTARWQNSIGLLPQQLYFKYFKYFRYVKYVKYLKLSNISNMTICRSNMHTAHCTLVKTCIRFAHLQVKYVE